MGYREGVQTVYTIYHNASDWPGEYVIKRWLVPDAYKALHDQSHMEQDLNYMYNAQTLEECRAELLKKGLTNVGRARNDDAVIVESWIE